MTRATFTALLAAILAACGSGTTAPVDVAARRAHWDAFHFHDYSYVYFQTGFFINYTGHQVRVIVHGDSVVALRDPTTGDSLPWSPQFFPTIDQLFNRAMAAEEAGQLGGITYDPTYGYPTRVDFSGLPDASGSVFASELDVPGSCALAGAWGWEMNFNPGGSDTNRSRAVQGDSLTGSGVSRGIGPSGTLDSLVIAGHFVPTFAPPPGIALRLTYRSGRVVDWFGAQACPDTLSGTATENGQSYPLVFIRGRTVG